MVCVAPFAWFQQHARSACSTFVEVNSGDVENYDDELKQLTTVVPARVMLAQPRGALSDLNGRKPIAQIKDKLTNG